MMDNFNLFISEVGLKEIQRKGGRFTWTNKQVNPTMCALDRVFACPRWDQQFISAICLTLTRVGSEHCPILVDTNSEVIEHKYNFRFEMVWDTTAGFREAIQLKWPLRGNLDVHEHWKHMKYFVRKWCKGWSSNLKRRMTHEKQIVLVKIQTLDRKAEV